jgi:hypothetical protein
MEGIKGAPYISIETAHPLSSIKTYHYQAQLIEKGNVPI